MSTRKYIQGRPLIDRLSRALSPIPYWIGYKRAKYWSHEVPEAAIVAELRETLMLAFGPDVSVRYEVPYSEIGRSERKAIFRGRQQQADLAIFQLKGSCSPTPVAVVEVERGYTKGAIRGDFHKLVSLSEEKRSSLRRFIVLVSEGDIPKFALAKTGSLHRARGLIDLDFKGASISAKRTFKAISSVVVKRKKPQHTSQHWAVLLEVE